MLLSTLPAFAQHQPADPAFLQRAISAMQAQRNQAMDAAAVLQARADGLQDELSKAQAKLKELDEKPDASLPSKKHELISQPSLDDSKSAK